MAPQVGNNSSALLTEEQALTARLMMKVVFYAETVRLVPASTEAGIDLDDFDRALQALATHGLVRQERVTSRLTDLERTARRAASWIAALDSALPSCTGKETSADRS